MYVLGYYLTMSPALIWIGIAIFFLIMEAFSMGLTTIWFCLGAVAAALIALLAPTLIPLQLIVFLVASIVLLYFTKPLAKSKLNIGTERTNVNAIIGKEGIVTESVEPFGSGQVKVDGQIWTAVAQDNDSVIEKGSTVLVRQVEGVKLIVEEKQ